MELFNPHSTRKMNATTTTIFFETATRTGSIIRIGSAIMDSSVSISTGAMPSQIENSEEVSRYSQSLF